MIEEHAARLRPNELYPKWGSIQLWVAPGDSEVDVAYCKPEIQFVQMSRVTLMEQLTYVMWELGLPGSCMNHSLPYWISSIIHVLLQPLQTGYPAFIPEGDNICSSVFIAP